MKTLVIGGTGHIGQFLTKMLADDGQEVLVQSSGRTAVPAAASARVKYAALDYTASLRNGAFLALLQAEKPTAVVDILQGDSASVAHACQLAGVTQLVACGSVWMFGRPKVVPTPAVAQTKCPFDGYQRRYTEMLQLLARAPLDGLAFTAIMPPNICGPGKIPLDGHGGRSLEVHRAHQRGVEIILPDPGTTLVGPCDAEDVAQAFFLAVKHPEAAGEIYNVGSAYALTAERFVRTYGDIYGTPIPVRYVSPETYTRDVLPDLGSHFHFLEHMCPDISRTVLRLGYAPRHTPEQTMERAVRWMVDQKLLVPK